jgi:glucosylceramidase
MKSRKILLMLTAATFLITSGTLSGCKDQQKTETEKGEKMGINGNVGVWLTTIDEKNLLAEQPGITPQNTDKTEKNGSAEPLIISVNPEKTYQQMDGFGGSFTDASAWLVFKALPEKERNELMEKLFTKENGINMSFLRQPMGASDFAHELYSYDDMPAGETDFNLEKFSIDHDKEYIIPAVKQAMSLNPKLKVMASPWSAPGWMKTSDNLIGGALRYDTYEVYSKYFSKFIKAYEEEGIPIYAITPQNEPMYVPTEYTGMRMDPNEQVNFINNHLGPEFEKNNINAKIIAYDHNWDLKAYPMVVLKQASKYVAGSAWHCYGGSHDAMTAVHDKFPDKEIWFTEASGGEWVPPFKDAFNDQMKHVIRATRNFAKTVVWWNIALDQKNGPTVLSNSTCRGIVKIDSDTKEVTYNLDYYTMGHISKFVEPGAYRIDSDNYQDEVETVAFKNPDNSIVLIAHNRSTSEKTFKVNYGDSNFEYTLPSNAAVTFAWNINSNN